MLPKALSRQGRRDLSNTSVEAPICERIPPKLSGSGITGTNDRFYVPAHVKIALDLDPLRVAGSNEIFENDVDDMFVKDLYFAKRIDVELEAFQFDTELIRHVFKTDDGKI